MLFSDFQHEMKLNNRIRISRLTWKDTRHYIYWDASRNAYSEHIDGLPDMEWCWDEYRTAYEDLTALDWRVV